MADTTNRPENGLKSPGFNTWGHVGVPKDNFIYDFLDETKRSSDALFETINFAFEFLNSILDFIASLLIDFTNPLKPIIEEIISILESFILDLRNTGLYITYDKEEFKKPLEKLRGGYPAFEQRMIKKLLQKKDKSRPDFSQNTKVFAMTFFAGADITSIAKIIDKIRKLIKMFSSGKDEPPGAPINLSYSYYNSIVGEIESPSSYDPDGIRVKWAMPSPTSPNRAFPTSFVMPDYFLVSVSTRSAFDKIGYLETITSSVDPSYQGSEATFTRLKTLTDGPDARLWSLLSKTKIQRNAYKIDESSDHEPLEKTPSGVNMGDLVWVMYNGEQTYLGKIDGQKISEIYRLYIYDSGFFGGLLGDNSFSVDLPFDLLKINSELASEYYVSLFSLSSVEDSEVITRPGSENPKLITEANIIKGLEKKDQFQWSSQPVISHPSSTITVKPPSDLRTKYLYSVRFFFLSYALARLDSDVSREAINLEITGPEQEVIDKFLRVGSGLVSLRDGSQSRQKYAQDVIDWVDRIMINFKSLMPSDSEIASLGSVIERVANFKYNLYQILEDVANGKSNGVYRSKSQFDSEHKPFTIPESEYKGTSSNYNPDPDWTGSISNTLLINEKILEDTNPILYFTDTQRKFFGNLYRLKDFSLMVSLAKPLIALSPDDRVGQWINFKPFRDADLSSIIEFMDTIKKYLEGFIKGMEGIVAQILKYINTLKNRIAQLQAIIQKIKSIIDLILSFRLPAGLYGTFHLTDGTSGLVSALVQSKDKPDISGKDSYGTGAMIVAAGATPTPLIDFFIALLGAEGGEGEA